MFGGVGAEQPMNAETTGIICSMKSQLEVYFGTIFQIFVPISYRAQLQSPTKL